MTLIPGEHRMQDHVATERKERTAPTGGTRTDTYKLARPLVIWLLAGLGGSAFGIAAWAHAKLWDHDGSIKIQGEWQRGHDLNQQRVDDKLEKRLDRMESKIDAIMAQGHRP